MRSVGEEEGDTFAIGSESPVARACRYSTAVRAAGVELCGFGLLLDEGTWAAAWMEGRPLSLEQATAYALKPMATF